MLGRDQNRSAGKQISDLHSKDYRSLLPAGPSIQIAGMPFQHEGKI